MRIIILNKYFFKLLLFFIISISLSIAITYMMVTNSNEIEITYIEELENNIIDEFSTRQDMLVQKYSQNKLIALTFDDGPSKYTNNLIDELNKRKINVTFFILGENANKYPDTLKFAYDSNNEIAIHSYAHKMFTSLSEDEIIEQIDKTKVIISIATGNSPTLIRVPYGSVNAKVENILNKLNITNVKWNVDSLDWKFKNVNKTYNYILKSIKGNSIILMHDSYKTSVETALKIIDKLQSEGYEFVTVSEFLKIQNIVENNKK